MKMKMKMKNLLFPAVFTAFFLFGSACSSTSGTAHALLGDMEEDRIHIIGFNPDSDPSEVVFDCMEIECLLAKLDSISGAYDLPLRFGKK